MAGRTLTEEDSRLSLFAVGDDDQNIYSFNGSSVEFIRRFEQDYNARPAFLIDNYRSTRHIIDAANAVIGPAGDRMKADHAIRINQERAKAPAGGQWAERDPVARGKIQVLRTGDNSAISQAQAAVAELKRLSSLDTDWDWSKCAVIAREWSYLEPVRTVCEQDGIPVQMANEDNLSLWHLRETQKLVNWVRQRGPGNAPQRRREGLAGQAAPRPMDRTVAASRGGTQHRDRHRRRASGIVHRMAGRVVPRHPPPPERVAAADSAPSQGPGVRPRSRTRRRLGAPSAGARTPTPHAASTTWP